MREENKKESEEKRREGNSKKVKSESGLCCIEQREQRGRERGYREGI